MTEPVTKLDNATLEQALNQLIQEVSEWTHAKGWRPDPTKSLGDEMIMLVTEIAEVIEAYRKCGRESRKVYHRNWQTYLFGFLIHVGYTK